MSLKDPTFFYGTGHYDEGHDNGEGQVGVHPELELSFIGQHVLGKPVESAFGRTETEQAGCRLLQFFLDICLANMTAAAVQFLQLALKIGHDQKNIEQGR
jgi:hypothetical protein